VKINPRLRAHTSCRLRGHRTWRATPIVGGCLPPSSLGRNLRHLIAIITDLSAREVGFRSLTEGIDTTTPSGRLVFHLFGALAEFERELIRERTIAGLTAARARGRSGGRPRVMTPDKLAVARQLYDSKEHTLEAIAATIEVSRSTLYRHLAPGAASS
jgi:DNA invertase Pin-like site-specific DNA recombinase